MNASAIIFSICLIGFGLAMHGMQSNVEARKCGGPCFTWNDVQWKDLLP